MVAATFASIISEPTSLAEAISVLRTAYGSITEQITLLDGLKAGGWFKIDDSQTLSWTAISNTQGSGWSSISDAETPNWVVINNSQ